MRIHSNRNCDNASFEAFNFILSAILKSESVKVREKIKSGEECLVDKFLEFY